MSHDGPTVSRILALIAGGLLATGCIVGGGPQRPEANDPSTTADGSVGSPDGGGGGLDDPIGGADASTVEDTEIGAEPLSLTADDCERRARSACVYAARCLGDTRELAECIAFQREGCRSWIRELGEALAGGRLAHDGAEERDCYRDRETLDCGVLADRPGCLERAVEGLVPAGGSCFGQWECGEDHYCAYEDACPGRCEPRAGEGEACPDGWKQCADDLRCVGDPARCVRPPVMAEGEICEQQSVACEPGTRCRRAPGERFDSQRRCRADAAEGEPCDQLGYCAPGLVCVAPLKITDSYDVGVCRSEAAEGESCKESSDCAAGLRCLDDGLSTRRRRCGRPLPSGAACTDLVDYRVCGPSGCIVETACAPGERCLPDGDPATSHCGPARAAGKPCTETVNCADGLFCNESERCERYNQRGVGQACQPYGEGHCTDGLYCAEDATCQPRMAEGEACGRSHRCAEGLACRFGHCRANCS